MSFTALPPFRQDLISACKGSHDTSLRAAGLIAACVVPLVSAFEVDPAAGTVAHGSG